MFLIVNILIIDKYHVTIIISQSEREFYLDAK